MTPISESVRRRRPEPPPGRRTVSLGGGLSVPYPEPRDEAATRVGKSNRRVDSRPEVLIRSAVHRRGLRFRKDFLLHLGAARVRPDLVFTRCEVAVFVDGCFWHGCPDHQRVPRRNTDYWVPKLQANVDRDRRIDAALADGGWDVLRIWEHEVVESAVDRLVDVLEGKRGTSRRGPGVSSYSEPDRRPSPVAGSRDG
jgi:DNA mismatch endonuclease (patch repair protein)